MEEAVAKGSAKGDGEFGLTLCEMLWILQRVGGHVQRKHGL